VFQGILGVFLVLQIPLQKLLKRLVKQNQIDKPIQGIPRYAIFCFRENWRRTFLGVLKLMLSTINKLCQVAESNAGLFRKGGLISKEIMVLLPWESETQKSGFIN